MLTAGVKPSMFKKRPAFSLKGRTIMVLWLLSLGATFLVGASTRNLFFAHIANRLSTHNNRHRNSTNAFLNGNTAAPVSSIEDGGAQTHAILVEQEGKPLNGFTCPVKGGKWGSTRCSVGDVGYSLMDDNNKLPVTLFQLYHGQENHKYLYDCTHPLYRGVAQTPGVSRKGYNDIDVTAELLILRDRKSQGNLCEYSSMFGLLAGGYLDSTGRAYAGTQSWKAAEKGHALSCSAERALVGAIRHAQREKRDVFLYWAGLGPEFENGLAMRFYHSSAYYHSDAVLMLFRKTFAAMFGDTIPEGLEDGLPPMPEDDEPWAYMSYFAMDVERLKEYLYFAAHFWALLATQWQAAIQDPRKCPLTGGGDLLLYTQEHCFCFLVERLVNIWVYHKGIPFRQLYSKNGKIVERHPLKKRRMLPWFTDGSLEASLEALRSRNNDVAAYVGQLLKDQVS